MLFRSWEYHIEQALFTVPPRSDHSGAGLFNLDGELLGIGSLLVVDTTGSGHAHRPGNMFVPIDLLDPILDDLVARGRSAQPPRAWLGLYATEVDGRILVGGLAPGAPAEKAGLQLGDVVLEVAGQPIAGLADLFRKVWRLGPAGTEVPLTASRRGKRTEHFLRSADRADFLKKPLLH